MAAPSLTDILAQVKAILDEMDFGEMTPGVWPRPVTSPDYVAPLYTVFTEPPESFDNGENIDVLRSPKDLYNDQIEGVAVEIGRVNAWILDELSLAQTITPLRDSRGREITGAGGRATITRIISLFFYYQFGGGGVSYVRDVLERTRRRFNELPKLGFSAEVAEFIDGRNGGLQVPLETEGDFKGVIAYVRGCQLTLRIIEPL
jgi:hypothetical protein